jgi:hypothetical protein
MYTEPKEPREFSDFSSGQDGWGNSILDEPRYRITEEEEDVDGIREANFWANFNEDTVTIQNKNDGSMECGKDG